MKISKEPEKTLVSITAILALAIVVVFGMQYGNRQSMEHNPRAVIIKHRIKETPDSVTYKVVTYKIDSTYEETLPKSKKILGETLKNRDKTLKNWGK